MRSPPAMAMGVFVTDTINFIRLHVNSRIVNLLKRWKDILKAGT